MVHRDIVRNQILALAVPASLEAVLQMGFGFVDQVVIARLGDAPLAAVALVNQIMFLLTLVLGAIASSTAILVAQAYGREDKDGVSLAAGGAFLIAGLVTLPLTLVPLLSPGAMLRLLGAEPEVVAAGGPFFRVIALTLPLSLLGTVAVGVLRSLGDAKTPMLITFLAVVANTLLNLLLVFGVGPLPAFGVLGAAFATLIAQLLRLGVLLYCMLVRQRAVRFRWAHFTTFNRWIWGRIVALSLPIAGTGALWALGNFIYTLICLRLGTTAIVANQLVLATENVFLMFSSGLAVAGLTLVGQGIGYGDLSAVREKTRKVIQVGIHSSGFFGFLLAGAAFLVDTFYPEISPETLQLVTLGLILNAIFQPAKVLNMVMGNGVLRAGGDTRFLLLADILSIYVLAMPLTLLLCFPLGLGILGVFIGRIAEEVSRVAIFFWRYRTPHWHRSLTLGQVPAEEAI